MCIFSTRIVLPLHDINILMVLRDSEMNGTWSVQRGWWWRGGHVMSQKGLIFVSLRILLYENFKYDSLK
jgi:hypothetical protein